MSKERQRARAARQDARRAEVEAAARRREKEAGRQALRARLTPRVTRRPRRYGALPTQLRVKLVLGFLAVQAVGWWLLAAPAQRLGLAVLTAGLFLIAVKTRRSPQR